MDAFSLSGTFSPFRSSNVSDLVPFFSVVPVGRGRLDHGLQPVRSGLSSSALTVWVTGSIRVDRIQPLPDVDRDRPPATFSPGGEVVLVDGAVVALEVGRAEHQPRRQAVDAPLLAVRAALLRQVDRPAVVGGRDRLIGVLAVHRRDLLADQRIVACPGCRRPPGSACRRVRRRRRAPWCSPPAATSATSPASDTSGRWRSSESSLVIASRKPVDDLAGRRSLARRHRIHPHLGVRALGRLHGMDVTAVGHRRAPGQQHAAAAEQRGRA